MVKLIYFSDLAKGHIEVIKRGTFTCFSIIQKDGETETRAFITLDDKTVKELKDYL